MTKLVARADTTVTPNVTPARTATSPRRVARVSRDAANANGTIPANQSSGSEAALVPAKRPTPTKSGHGLLPVRNSSPAPRTTAPTGVVTCAVNGHERPERERSGDHQRNSRGRDPGPASGDAHRGPAEQQRSEDRKEIAARLPELCVPGEPARRKQPPQPRPAALVGDVHGAAATETFRKREDARRVRVPADVTDDVGTER